MLKNVYTTLKSIVILLVIAIPVGILVTVNTIYKRFKKIFISPLIINPKYLNYEWFVAYRCQSWLVTPFTVINYQFSDKAKEIKQYFKQ